MTKPFFGNPITLAGSNQVKGLWTSYSVFPPLQINRWVRNSKHPNASFESMKRGAATQCALYRTKEYFGGIAPLVNSVHSNGVTNSPDEDRWRFAFHSGPYAHAMGATIVMMSPNVGAGLQVYGQLKLATSNTETPVVASQNFDYGAWGGPGGWANFKVFNTIIPISPDTDYYCVLREFGFAQVQSATLFELASLTQNFNGYLGQNIGAQTPILDVYRENLATMMRALWRRGASRAWNWNTLPANAAVLSSGDDATDLWHTKTTTSGIERNILDFTSAGGGSTTITANTPGWTAVMTNKDRISQSTGIPVVMKAWGFTSAGTGGNLRLKDSTGTPVAIIQNAWTTTPSWQSVAFTIPATSAKYDLHFASFGGERFSLGAVSIYEHET